MGYAGVLPDDESAMPDEMGAVVDGDESTDEGAWTRWAPTMALVSVALPFVVMAVVLVVVGRDHMAVADHAGIEAQVRHVGREEVLVGLYSRIDWNHPGPLFFYLAAPIYWLTGGNGIGVDLAALLLNGASVAGMALLARRRGGTPLLLCTVLGAALVMRSLGADFLHDPWNTYTPTLPYGLLLLLVWSVLSGDLWALPLAAAVATLVAQTHVGFVALALPLLAWSAGWVAWRGLKAAGASRRRSIRALALSTGLLGVLWLPPAIDVLTNRGSNARRMLDYLLHPDQPAHTLAQGWQVMLGQFEWLPEWIAGKRAPVPITGETPYIFEVPWPVLLLPVVVAAVVLWRRRGPADRQLLVTLSLASLLGVVAVWRTVGIHFDYRLRWTWLPAMVAGVMAAWVGWRELVRRVPWAEQRVLLPGSLAGIGVLLVVNTGAALRADELFETDSQAMASVSADVLEELDRLGVDGPILVEGSGFGGIHYARGLLLQLDRHGFDGRVPRSLWMLREYSTLGDDEAAVELVVATQETMSSVEDLPGYRLVATWPADTSAQQAARTRLEELEADHRAGRLSGEELFEAATRIGAGLEDTVRCGAFACEVAVFVRTAPAP